MGTGAVGGLIARFHFGQDTLALKILTFLFFFLDLVFFILICGATVARYYMFPEVRSIIFTAAAELSYTIVVVGYAASSDPKSFHWSFCDGLSDRD